MKCVTVGDIFITSEMMHRGIKGVDSLMFDRVDYFYFGQDSQLGKRCVVKTFEIGGFKTLPIPEGLVEAVEDADMLMCHLCPVTKMPLARATGSTRRLREILHLLPHFDKLFTFASLSWGKVGTTVKDNTRKSFLWTTLTSRS